LQDSGLFAVTQSQCTEDEDDDEDDSSKPEFRFRGERGGGRGERWEVRGERWATLNAERRTLNAIVICAFGVVWKVDAKSRSTLLWHALESSFETRFWKVLNSFFCLVPPASDPTWLKFGYSFPFLAV
jgi:hypothetical protein